MLKVKKGDTVVVIKGKDRGKKGKVINVFGEERRALVEAVNMVKKHRRQARQDQQGGITSVEAPIRIANLMVLCKGCNRPARIGFIVGKDGLKQRFCKKCKGVL
ncbi:MAG: 50S ribosomal protein L24 [Candidatus Omnitrophica bacterium]|nr:50S ribosomal protein L24 [Candidatus Omnitrophota bacterium]